MKLGLMNNPRNSVFDEIWLAGEYKFDFLELTIEAPEATPEKLKEDKAKILDSLSTYNLKLLAHSPWTFEFSHPYQSIRAAFLREQEKVIETAADFGAKKLTVHTDHMHFVHKDRKKFFELLADSFKKIYSTTQNAGITLCIENFEEKAFTMKEHEQLFELLPEAKLTLDVAHANLSAPNNQAIFDFIKTFKKKITHVHASDNKGEKDDHLPIGTGKIKWEPVLAKLKQSYDDTITLEIHSEDREYLKISKEKIEKMWKRA
ncbi:sugar phosphate isomerase/epimerase [Candidatus Micrarchaeota archaeon]|nr:sugar phosphate isomerase/epimerase [Candidatus Micrarchaeota archaeon]